MNLHEKHTKRFGGSCFSNDFLLFHYTLCNMFSLVYFILLLVTKRLKFTSLKIASYTVLLSLFISYHLSNYFHNYWSKLNLNISWMVPSKVCLFAYLKSQIATTSKYSLEMFFFYIIIRKINGTQDMLLTHLKGAFAGCAWWIKCTTHSLERMQMSVSCLENVACTVKLIVCKLVFSIIVVEILLLWP